MTTARTYTHVVATEDELDYAALVYAPPSRAEILHEHCVNGDILEGVPVPFGLA